MIYDSGSVFSKSICSCANPASIEREFFIDNLLVRIHFIIVMIRWTGLAPWVFEFPFPGSLTQLTLRLYLRSGGGGAGAGSGGQREPRQFKNNHFTEMCCGIEVGSYLRRIDSCITQLKAQGPSRTCNESKEEVKEVLPCRRGRRSGRRRRATSAPPTRRAPRRCPPTLKVASNRGWSSGIFSVVFRRAPGKSETTFVKQNYKLE